MKRKSPENIYWRQPRHKGLLQASEQAEQESRDQEVVSEVPIDVLIPPIKPLDEVHMHGNREEKFPVKNRNALGLPNGKIVSLEEKVTKQKNKRKARKFKEKIRNTLDK